MTGSWLRISDQRAREAAALWEAERAAWAGTGLERIQVNQGGITLLSGTRITHEPGKGYMAWMPEVIR